MPCDQFSIINILNVIIMQKRQTFSTRYYCRECKRNRQGMAPVELSIIINGERTFMSLPRKMAPSDFNKQVSARSNNDTKQFISLYEAKVNGIVSEILMRNENLTAQRVKDYLLGNVCHTHTLRKAVLAHMGLLAERTRSEITLGCYKRYETTYNALIDFLGDKDIKTITTGDMISFRTHIMNTHQTSTAYGYMTRVKTLFKYCIDNEWLSHSPMDGVKTPRGERKIQVLTEAEYGRIRDARFDIPRLERVRKIFVVMCNCGLAYADIQRLQPSDIQYVDGRMVIEKTRKKTGTLFTSVVLDDGRKILEDMGGDFSSLRISGQKLNSYLKTIADHCRVRGNLASHMARHRYITHLMRLGIPVQIVQRAAGHSNISTTMHYTHLLKDDVVNAFK